VISLCQSVLGSDWVKKGFREISFQGFWDLVRVLVLKCTCIPEVTVSFVQGPRSPRSLEV